MTNWEDFVGRAAYGIEADIERLQYAMSDYEGREFVIREYPSLILSREKLTQLIEEIESQSTVTLREVA